ncbi:MAG: response regulator [Campylobacterota bacterium]|nr:response regulator [Campylobacterota bacterium]
MITAKELKNITSDLTLLYVEDENELRDSVKTYLSKLFALVVSAKNGQEGLEHYQKKQFDIVVSDIQMPVMDGLSMSKAIKDINPNQEIIITSAYSETSYFLDSIKVGINGYIIKPIDYTQMNQELSKSALRVNQLKENINYKLHLEEIVTQRTEKIIAMEAEKIKNFEATILSFVEMIEDRDTYTAGHSQRVATYAKLIAQEMGQSEEDCELLYKAGIIHDIGKIATPDTVLLKPGKLNNLEYKLIQEHVSVGYRLLSKIPMYAKHAEIIIGHHERYDGKGYPNGLKGDEISLLSHILLVADAFDAMTTNRIYKGRKNLEYAISELRDLSGKQFHPEVTKSAIKVLSNIEMPKDITQLPKTDIEKERFSYFFRDQVTDAYNSDYLNFILEHNIIEGEFSFVYKLYLHNFNNFNNSHGWNEGDKLLNGFVKYLKGNFPLTTIFRVHGDDFILMTKESLDIDIEKIQLLDIFADNNITLTKESVSLKDKNIEDIKKLEALI